MASGLDTPTTMAFLGPNDILVLEKDKGTVQRVVNGKILGEPLLDVNVANSVERCMCGIAISKHDSKTYVFLYYTEINGKDGEDRQGKEPSANRLYRYELVGNKLVDPLLLLISRPIQDLGITVVLLLSAPTRICMFRLEMLMGHLKNKTRKQ